jgi:hypothetical protein
MENRNTFSSGRVATMWRWYHFHLVSSSSIWWALPTWLLHTHNSIAGAEEFYLYFVWENLITVEVEDVCTLH